MQEKHTDFFPTGSIYFFLFMIAFYALIWFLAYAVLLERG